MFNVFNIASLRDQLLTEVTRPKENKARECYLSLDEITRLLDACRYSRSPYLYPIVVFALSTGARRGEILNIKWPDLDFQRGTAIFRDTKNGDSPYSFTHTPSPGAKRQV